MKTDARVRYTKKTLREALLTLMAGKSIKEITVKELCAQAEINRATFYNHYRDCYDLLEQIENDLIADYEESLKYVAASDITDLLVAIFNMIDKNYDLCGLMIQHRADDAIIKKMIAITHDASVARWRGLIGGAGDAELEMLFTCLANGLMHVVLEYYDKIDRGALIAFVRRTVQGCVSAFGAPA